MMKKKEAIVTEPEMVYARATTAAPAARGVLMQYIVPKKDQSFLEDMAQVRGWKMVEKAKRLSGLDKAIQEVKRGEVWEYASVEDMFDQILGKGRRKKHVPNACTLKAMKDAREGRVFHAESPQDLIKQILGDV